MSKLNADYESSFAFRFLKWVREGTTLDHSTEDFVYEDQVQENALKKEIAREERRQTELEEEAQMHERLHRWSRTKGSRIFTWLYRLAAVGICIPIILFLLQAVAQLPAFGSADVPAMNEVPRRYVENAIAETGATNAVAGMILDYRAFDTFGESTVLFTAACAVLLLLRLETGRNGKPSREQLEAAEKDLRFEPRDDAVLTQCARVLVPVILLFGVYVILNGHISPGGGFSGGAIIGAGMILHLNAFGFAKTSRIMRYNGFKTVTFLALLFYAGAKSYSFYTGANHIESGIALGTPGAILSAGLILPLNICVGLIVAYTMYAFYVMFRKGGF